MITLTFIADIDEQIFNNLFEENIASYAAEKRGDDCYSFDVKIPRLWFIESANTFGDFLSAIREYFIAIGELREEKPIPAYVEGAICSEEGIKSLLPELNNYKNKKDAFIVQVTNRECWEDERTKLLGVFTDIKMAKAAIREEVNGESFTPYLDWIQEIEFNKTLD